MSATALLQRSVRRITHKPRGRTHGMVTRLMSPGDLGQRLKPFVFLDLFDNGLFDNGGKPFTGFGLYPHSGIATLTYMAQGTVSYEDTNGATGLLPEGGVEWMRAGNGVWHGGGAGEPGRAWGFQLWVALPPHRSCPSSWCRFVMLRRHSSAGRRRWNCVWCDGRHR